MGKSNESESELNPILMTCAFTCPVKRTRQGLQVSAL